jgi:hypothetical protein
MRRSRIVVNAFGMLLLGIAYGCLFMLMIAYLIRLCLSVSNSYYNVESTKIKTIRRCLIYLFIHFH